MKKNLVLMICIALLLLNISYTIEAEQDDKFLEGLRIHYRFSEVIYDESSGCYEIYGGCSQEEFRTWFLNQDEYSWSEVVTMESEFGECIVKYIIPDDAYIRSCQSRQITNYLRNNALFHSHILVILNEGYTINFVDGIQHISYTDNEIFYMNASGLRSAYSYALTGDKATVMIPIVRYSNEWGIELFLDFHFGNITIELYFVNTIGGQG